MEVVSPEGLGRVGADGELMLQGTEVSCKDSKMNADDGGTAV